jgi:polyisoprenoid-binding protein YceI
MHFMNPTLFWAGCSALATLNLLVAGPGPSGVVREGRLSFDGRATTGSFSGSTTTVTGEMTGGPTLATVRGWVEAPVKTLVTGNGKRDADLNKSMESAQYPVIRYELAQVIPGTVHGDTTAVTLQGSFIIHGVRRPADLPAQVISLPEGVRLRSDIPLNLKDYRIGGLTKLLGALRMDEHILVHVDLRFGQPGGAPRNG